MCTNYFFYFHNVIIQMISDVSFPVDVKNVYLQENNI